MATIPVSEDRIVASVPQVSEPRISGPVSGAFGKNIGQATENMGRGLGQVGGFFAKVAEQDNNVRDAQIESQYVQAWQDKLYNQDIETVDINGQQVQRPKGYLVRMGTQVDKGMPVSMIQDNNTLENSLLAQESNPRRRAELQIKFQNHFSGIRENGIRHTIDEIKKTVDNTFQQTGKNYIDSARLSNTPAALTGNISNIMLNNKNWMERMGKDEAWLTQQNHNDIEKSIWEATDSVLESTGDIERAKALLNSPELKDYIPEDLYEMTENKLDGAVNRITSIKKSLAIEQEMKTTLNFLTDTTNGKINWTNVDDVVREANKINPKLGQAIQKVSMLPADVIYRGTNIDDMSFANSAQKMFEIKDNKILNDYLLDVLRQSPAGNLSGEKLTILLSLARNQAIANNPKLPNSQAVKEDNDNLRNVIDYIGMTIPGIAPLAIIDLLKRKFSKNLTGEQLKIESQKVINQHTLNNNPSIRGLNGIPNKIVNGDDPVETIYNGANQLQGEKYNGSENADTYRESSNEF